MIPIGSEVTEVSTGLIGYVTQRLELLSGNVQYAVQPRGDGKTVPDALMFDAQCLNVVGKGISDRASPVESPTAIKLGQKVKDIVSGFTGIAYSKATFLNGCEFINVNSKVNKDNEALTQFVNAMHLRVVDDGVLDTMTPPKKTGGPYSRIAPTAARRSA